MKKLTVATIAASIFLLVTPSFANEDRIAELEQQIAELQEELNELKGSETQEQSQDSDSPIYEDDSIRIWYNGIGEPDYSHYSFGIKVIIENKTDYSVEVYGDEISVNGFMVDHNFIADISSGKKIKATINVEDDTKPEEVEEVEVKFVYEIEDGNYDYIQTDLIKFM